MKELVKLNKDPGYDWFNDGLFTRSSMYMLHHPINSRSLWSQVFDYFYLKNVRKVAR